MPISTALLATLDQKRRAAYAGGGEDKLAERLKRGILTARDRLAALFQENTFMEWGLHAQHDCHNFGMEEKSMPGDGVVTGVGDELGRVLHQFLTIIALMFPAVAASLAGMEAHREHLRLPFRRRVGVPALLE